MYAKCKAFKTETQGFVQEQPALLFMRKNITRFML